MSLIHKYSFANALNYTQYIESLFAGMSDVGLAQYHANNPGIIDVVLEQYSVGLLIHPDFDSATPKQQVAAQTAFQNMWSTLGEHASIVVQATMLETLSGIGNLEAVSVMIQDISDSDVIEMGPEVWGNVISNVALSYQNPEADVSVVQSNNLLADMMEMTSEFFVNYIPFLDQMGGVMEQLSASANIIGFNVISEYLGAGIAYLEVEVLENIFMNVAVSHEVTDSIVTLDEANDTLASLVQSISEVDIPLSAPLNAEFIESLLESMKVAGNDQGLDAIITNITHPADIDLFTEYLNVEFGNEGADMYLYDPLSGSSEYLYGLGGDDYIEDQWGDTYINAGDGDDVINMDVTPGYASGINLVYGGDGSDVIYAGQGNNDTFVFREGDTGVDSIYNFHDFYDRLDLSDLLDDYDPLQDAIDDFVQLTTVGNDVIVSVDVDGLGTDAVAQDIVTIHDNAGLLIEDIIDIQDYI